MMNKNNFNRRNFIKNTATSSLGLAVLGTGSLSSISATYIKKVTPRINFSVIGINHGHIYAQVELILRGGGKFISFFGKEPELVNAFSKRYPNVKLAGSENEVLEDESVDLILSASIPDERAPLGIRAMLHGKDFMVDKPGITTLQQLEDVRYAQKKTNRIYSINTERCESQSIVKAGELVKSGAIGKVVQTIGLGSHRMNPGSRPEWFFDAERSGGIICDIGSHQFDQYLFFTGTTKPQVVAAQKGNITNMQYPMFEDFGDVMLRGDGGMGYLRVDWFSPDGLKTWGDGRLTILGTDGYIEIRKNIDIEGRPGRNHLFLVNQKEKKYVDCSDVSLNYGQQLVDDVLNRTETAMGQEYCFLVAELGLIAQKKAQRIG